MTAPSPTRKQSRQRVRKALVAACYVLASAIGLALGWDFGNRVAGAWLGAVAALNCALFGAMLMSAVERGWNWLATRARQGQA